MQTVKKAGKIMSSAVPSGSTLQSAGNRAARKKRGKKEELSARIVRQVSVSNNFLFYSHVGICFYIKITSPN